MNKVLIDAINVILAVDTYSIIGGEFICLTDKGMECNLLLFTIAARLQVGDLVIQDISDSLHKRDYMNILIDQIHK